MILTVGHIAGLLDCSCVRTYSSKGDIQEMVKTARDYDIGHVTVLHCFLPYVLDLLKGQTRIQVCGNVSFPSGSDPTFLKVIQAKDIVSLGCAEIDMVMNIGLLRSGEVSAVCEDIRAVVQATGGLPVKVIIEVPYLSTAEVCTACEICVDAGAQFVKTSTGWTDRGTTIDDVRLIKSVVGDRIQIKASGGIRSLDTLLEMYRQGARRFGVNLRSAKMILNEAKSSSVALSV
ncbi:MAG TPA: deoxyribose-phosphate aldolase [Anaerolineaceae bacterium]|nr:deoxyribose-phosphate aldolase [Anaerolineaceae bacterium]